MNHLKWKQLHPKGVLHKPQYEHDAGLDLTTTGCVLPPKSFSDVPTGLCVEIPNHFFGLVHLRSSTLMKGILAACGIVDSCFRGPLGVGVFNATDRIIMLEPGQRFAQLVIMPYQVMDLIKVNELSESVRGEKGLGSSGRK